MRRHHRYTPRERRLGLLIAILVIGAAWLLVGQVIVEQAEVLGCTWEHVGSTTTTEGCQP